MAGGCRSTRRAFSTTARKWSARKLQQLIHRMLFALDVGNLSSGHETKSVVV
jgi:hypothetical protein